MTFLRKASLLALLPMFTLIASAACLAEASPTAPSALNTE